MKRILSMVFVLMMLLTAVSAWAENNMAVQVIGGPDAENEPVSLDDVKLNVDAEIEGYGIITPTSFQFGNYFGVYRQGKKNSSEEFNSGKEAEYAVLYVNILNTAIQSKNYLANYEVKAVFDDVYEYAGWAYQQNYNNDSWSSSSYPDFSKKQNLVYGINSADIFAIEPMYQGHYIFGCTLPNAIVNSKKPLRLVITIDGNEITYNIRK